LRARGKRRRQQSDGEDEATHEQGVSGVMRPEKRPTAQD
jgi:hypothetical protein